ncbi:hypothetical protein VTJ49DRAFT_5855 [Mycothermus thermophilus]|uniref:PHD-type domain-containing protein n=1 Tax=Humicola insolens TaxID=85995 RepID=A0ABR3V2X1_HUMIN
MEDCRPPLALGAQGQYLPPAKLPSGGNGLVRIKVVQHRKQNRTTRDEDGSQGRSKETKGVTLADQPDSAVSLDPSSSSSSSSTTKSNTPAPGATTKKTTIKMSANTRTTRSRFSSPQVSAHGGNDGSRSSKGANGEEQQKTFMQRWLEPPVQVKASYQEAGLMRGPIFENMAPLGTLPKVGLFKKTAVPSPAATSTASTPDDSTKTPFRRRIVIKPRQSAVPQTPTPAPPPPVAAPEEDETQSDATEEEDMDDEKTEEQEDDEEDGGAEIVDRQVQEARSSMMAAGRRARRALSTADTDDEEWAPGRASSRASRTRRSVSRASTRSQQSAAAPSLKEVVGKVVEAAVGEALSHYRYPTAWALRTLYDENSHNTHFLTLTQRVFTQTANADEFEDFARQVQAKKREGKKDNKALRHIVPDAAEEPPHPPKRAPYGNLVKFDVSTLHLERKRRGSKVPKKAKQTSTTAEEGAASSSSSGSTATPTTTAAASSEPAKKEQKEADAEPESELPPRKKRKSTRQPQEAPAPTTSAKGKMPVTAKTNGALSTAAGSSSSNNSSKAKAVETPSRRRTRARSSSSSISSLSSALSLTPPGHSQEDKENGVPSQERDETPSRSSPAPATSAAPTEPITGTKRRRMNAPRKARNANKTLSSRQQSPAAASTNATATSGVATQQSTAANKTAPSSAAAAAGVETPAPASSADAEDQPYAMPAMVDSPWFPPLPGSKKGSKGANLGIVFPAKFSNKAEEPSEQELKRRAHTAEARRHTATVPIPMSSVRGESRSPPAVSDREKRKKGKGGESSASTPATTRARPPTPMTAPATRPRSALATTVQSASSERPTPAREGRSTRSSLKRTHEETEDQQQQQPSSPAALTFPGSDAAPSTAPNSRAGTPALRAPKRTRTGLRVKNSPMKKKNGPSAGIPRASGERSSPVGNAREDDNDDYCSSCGGNGELLCCDGCTRSFHFTCVDPPLAKDAMSDEWFCNVCRSRRDPAHLPVRTGAFGTLLEKLDTRNASAFRLPAAIRDRFEGVRTGADGEYEEATQPVKPTRKKKADEELGPDFFTRLRDNDGNPVICHGCQRGSSAERALIIPCSACGLFWHLDCLDPPMAQPPVLRTWKCPLHTDDLLSKLPAQLAPAHRFRKVKDAPVIRPIFTRGYANNGFIDIDFDDDTEGSGWRDIESFGRTVRLSEKGIKLDFLSRLRERHPAPKPAPPQPAPTPSFQKVSLEAQQAALSLSALATQSAHRDDHGGLSALIDAMVNDADPNVINLMSRADATHIASGQLSRMDQQGLRAMLARAESVAEGIRKLLGESGVQAGGEKPAVEEEERGSGAAAAISAPGTTDKATASSSGDVEMADKPETKASTGDNTATKAANPDTTITTTTTTTTTTSNPTSPGDTTMLDAAPTANNNTHTKSAATSPAATDDVPAMTQGEKTPPPVHGEDVDSLNQSPSAPPPLLVLDEQADAAPAAAREAKDVDPAGEGDENNSPATPTKAAALELRGGEPVVVVGEDDDDERGAGEGEPGVGAAGEVGGEGKV